MGACLCTGACLQPGFAGCGANKSGSNISIQYLFDPTKINLLPHERLLAAAKEVERIVKENGR